MTTAESAPIPLPDPDSAAFWSATASGGLSIARCTQCRRWQHPPTEVCRICAGTLAMEPVSGRGTVFSFTVVRHQMVPGHTPPYVVALVELEEQAHLRVTAILRVAPDAAAIGQIVEAVLEPIGNGTLRAPEFVFVAS